MSDAFQNFREGKKLKRVESLSSPSDLLPWLLRMPTRSAAWREHSIVPPFGDHATFYCDYGTKPATRIALLQPYVEAVAHEAGIPLSLDFRKALIERRSGRQFPDTLPIQKGIEAVVKAAQRKSDEFAKRFGLTVRVTFPGWYAAGRVLLIEYRAQTNSQ